MKITDLAHTIEPAADHEIVGIRPGEKLHEQLISAENPYCTYEYDDFYKILPAINNWDSDANRIKDGRKVPAGFVYPSDTNTYWMSVDSLRAWIAANRSKLGGI
jgi:FlaA1/EpsC-like NDP-sugar epimerase